MNQLVVGSMMMAVMLFAGFEHAKASLPKCDFVVVALVKVKAGRAEEFKRHVRGDGTRGAPGILAPTRAEPGNITYSFQQSIENETEFTTYERWNTSEDLDAHMVTPHMKKFFDNVGPLFETAPVIKTLKDHDCV